MTIAADATRPTGPMVHALIPHVRATTHRLVLATLRLGDAELHHPAVTGLGTRRHVLARMARQADRTARALDGDDDATEPSDMLLDLDAAQLAAALTVSLGGVLGALLEHGEGAPVSGAERATALAQEHLAWLELTHIDLDAGYDMRDVPDASVDAIALHFRRARDEGAIASPFAELVAA